MDYNDKIQITSDLDLQYDDLMCIVDFSHPFTLRDVLNISCFSTIEIETLAKIINSRPTWMWELFEEAQKPASKEEKWDDNIDYLELSLKMAKGSWDGILNHSSYLSFDGVGKLGYVPEDIKKWIVDRGEELDPNYRQGMAIELTPVNEIADLQIKLKPEISIEDEDSSNFPENITKIPFEPQITVIEMLRAIFWELTFFGGPVEREEKSEMLGERCNEIKDAIKNGTIDEITTPWEVVKEKMLKKYEGEWIEEQKELDTKEQIQDAVLTPCKTSLDQFNNLK